MATEASERRKAAEIAATLRILGDALDNDPELNRILTGLAQESYIGRQYKRFTDLIREFVMLVARSNVVSAVNMVESIIRTFLYLWGNQAVSGMLLQELNPGTSVDIPETSDLIPPEISTNIPQEVKFMDDESIHRYYNVLSTGEQAVKSIRLMVVGMFGVGKTSLVENLVEKNNGMKTKNVESTVGIDVSNCDIIDGKWIENLFETDASQKIVDLMSSPGFSASPVDDVDARTVRTDSLVPNKNNEINIYERHGMLSENFNEGMETDTITQDNDFEGFKKKLVDKMSGDDDPFLKAFISDVFCKAKEPHLPLHPTITIWDFAGQYIYYSTHHFFLNSRSVYLLLMDISKPLDSLVQETTDFPLSGFLHREFTCLEAFKFWLNSIHMYYSQQVIHDVKPSVILVGTHKDCLTGSEEEKEKQKEDYFNKALKSFIGSPVLQHVHRKKFLINNLDENEAFGKIKEEVLNLAEIQSYWGETRPAKWITLERTFLGLKSEGKEIITFDKVKEMDSKSEISVSSEEMLRDFLRFQHSLGNILYYETDLLQNYVILSPQWIIDAFRCFVSHVQDKDPKQLILWENYENKAVLTMELIDEIIENNEKNEYFKDYKDQIIKYMEHLDMIAKPADKVTHAGRDGTENLTTGKEMKLVKLSVSDGDLETDFVGSPILSGSQDPSAPFNLGNDSRGLQQDFKWSNGQKEDASRQNVNTSAAQAYTDFFIVPSLLKSRPKMREISRQINATTATMKTPILCMKFQDGFMPPSVFHRLLAVCIRNYSIVEENEQCQLFNGFAVFYITSEKTSTLCIWFHDNIIYARVSFYSKMDQMLAQETRLFLVRSLTEILRILPKESRIHELMPFEEFIKCECVQDFTPGVGLLRMRNFMYSDTVMCEYPKLHTVNKSEAIGLWCYDSVQKQVNTAVTDSVLKRQPSTKELGRVARTIGMEYFRLGLELGLSRAILQQIREDDKLHLATAIYHMLYKRNNQASSQVLTFEHLRNAMIAVESDIESFDKLLLGVTNQHTELRRPEGVNFSRKPTDTELASLVDCIGYEYWLLGIELDIPETRMQHLRNENTSVGTFVYKMLKEWNQSNRNIEDLGKAMLAVEADIEGFYKVFRYDAKAHQVLV